MCGIAGIIWNENRPFKEMAIQRMTDALAHRGPDAADHYADEHIAFGHRRLSIVDLSPQANQPMWDHSRRFVICFNGMIYNYNNIKNELPGYPFKTTCDTETILAAYAQWGPTCIDKLEGMFAFAIWDTERQELFMARDRMGIKPFYYFHDESKFLFSSEIRGLFASGAVPKKLCTTAVFEYLNYQTVHAPNTMMEDVFQLMPGEYAVWKNGKLTKAIYWSLVPDDPSESPPNYGTAKKEVRRLFFEAVEKRLVSDVPFGAFLSGGIDSSAVVGVMSQLSQRQIETFSIVFEDKDADESPYSNLIADLNKTNHHPILLHPSDFLDDLPTALAAMDSPTGDGVNTFVVSKVTRKAGITVALSGLGGDELFGGYSTFSSYYKLVKNPFFWKIPQPLRHGAAAVSNMFLKSHQRSRVMELAGSASTGIEEIFPSFRKILSQQEIGLNANGKSTAWPNRVHTILKNTKGINDLPIYSRVTVADISTYTQNVLLRDTDQMSMAHALEVRVPFFDHRLVSYLVALPDHFKRLSYPKQLLVEALSPLVPAEVVHRPKLGFTLPWKVWMKNELKEFCQEKLDSFKERNLVSSGKIDHIWDTFSKGKNDFLWSRLWILVVLEDWLERNFDH